MSEQTPEKPVARMDATKTAPRDPEGGPAKIQYDPGQAPPDAPELTRDNILAVEDKKQRQIYVPEWGGVVYVRIISGRERDAFEMTIQAAPGGKRNMNDFRARFAALVLSDKEGKPLFSPADVQALTAKAAAPLHRILMIGQELNGFTDEAVEEMVKN